MNNKINKKNRFYSAAGVCLALLSIAAATIIEVMLVQGTSEYLHGSIIALLLIALTTFCFGKKHQLKVEQDTLAAIEALNVRQNLQDAA